MGNLSKILKNECDPRLQGELSYSLKEAYRFLDELIKSNPVLQNKEMKKSYGHIRQALVDVALKLVLKNSNLPSKVIMSPAKNNVNGYTYTMIETKGAIISPVKTRSQKDMPKKALYRSTASIKNAQFDLFTTEEDLNKLYDKDTPPFILLTYGGKNHKLQFIELGLPDVKNEKWIEKVDIYNAPRLIIGKAEETRKELDLSLTRLSEELLRGISDGTQQN